jgi:hypothetical protein
MRLAITRIPYADMGQPIVTLHKRYVLQHLHTYVSLSLSQGELEHRRVKRFYKTTNKVKFAEGIAKRQRREKILHNISLLDPSHAKKDDVLPPTTPEVHYHMSSNTKSYSDLLEWAGDRADDPAYSVSIEDHSYATPYSHLSLELYTPSESPHTWPQPGEILPGR